MNFLFLALATLPLALQGLAILVDEFYFHHKRDLPRWERIGHPLDTLTVTLVFLYLILVPYSTDALLGFIALAAASCLFVTKDEWVHATRCSPWEMWLHSVLFILHPIVFFVSGAAWVLRARPELVETLGLEAGNIELFWTIVVGQCLITVLFVIYQIGYWIIWRSAKETRLKGKTS